MQQRVLALVWSFSAFVSGTFSLAQGVAPIQPQAPATFDVVSIHPSDPALTTSDLGWNHGQLSGRNVSHSILIQAAYDIRDFQVSGILHGLDSARYDLNTKTEGVESEPEPTDAASRQKQTQAYQWRLQSMLADRFHLKLHVARKNMPMYALVIAKIGPKLQRSVQRGDYLHVRTLSSGSEMEARNIQLPDLADEISVQLQRKVMDETGLQGGYDFKLTWLPDNVPTPDNPPPSLFTALQEQLGLKLEPRTGPMDIYVIDHAEAPSPN